MLEVLRGAWPKVGNHCPSRPHLSWLVALALLPCLRRPLTSHLQAGSPQQDHDIIDEAQQGHEHGVLVVKPLAEEEREGDVGGSPAQQGQREGPTCGGDRPQGRGALGMGPPGPHSPPYWSSSPTRHRSSCRTLSATGRRPTPRPWKVRTASWRAAFQRGPEEKKMPVGPGGTPEAGAHCPTVPPGWPRPLRCAGSPRTAPTGTPCPPSPPGRPSSHHKPTPAPLDELEDGDGGPVGQLLPRAHQGLPDRLVAGQHHRLLASQVDGEHRAIPF